MDDEGDDTPDGKFLGLADFDGGEVGVLSFKKDASAPFPEQLHREIPVKHGDDDLALPQRDRAIHDQDVAALGSGIAHRIAQDTDKEGGCRVADEMLVEVERALHVVLGWRREPGLDVGGGQRDVELGACFKGDGPAAGGPWEPPENISHGRCARLKSPLGRDKHRGVYFPAKRMDTNSDEIIVRNLDTGWSYYPDWRTRVAEQYVGQCAASSDPGMPMAILDAEKDPYVRQAFRFRMGMGAVNQTALEAAYRALRTNKSNGMASMIKAMVVARRKAEEIAAELHVDRSVVVAFTRMFFDVEPYLGAEVWLQSLLFQGTEGRDDVESVRENRWLTIALFDGWAGLQAALFHRAPPTQESIEKTRIAIHAALSSRALEFARDIQMSGTPASSEDLTRFAMIANINPHKADDKAPTAIAFAKALMGIVLDVEGDQHDSSNDPAIASETSGIKSCCVEVPRYRKSA